MALFNFSNVNYSSYRLGFPREGKKRGRMWVLFLYPELLGPWTLRLCTDNTKYMDRFKSTDVSVANVVVADASQPRDE